MTGLRTVAGGLLLVLLDLRIDGLDLLPDPIGWAVAAWALGGLARRHRGFGVASAAAVVGLVCSVPSLVAPGPEWLWPVDAAASTVVVFATCTAVMALVPAEAQQADLLRWADLVLTFLVAALVSVAEQDDGLAILALVAGLAALAVFVLFVLLLLRAGRSGEGAPSAAGPGPAGPAGPAAPAPL